MDLPDYIRMQLHRFHVQMRWAGVDARRYVLRGREKNAGANETTPPVMSRERAGVSVGGAGAFHSVDGSGFVNPRVVSPCTAG